MTRILLLGVGRWGANHLRVLKSLPIELFVAEVDAKRLEQARGLGLDDKHLTTNYRDFAAQVDGAVVVTPAQTHYELCRELLEADKDVFVEKPITLQAKDGRALADLAGQRKRILQVGHIFRFDPASKWLRDAIGRGDFGRVKILRGDFSGFKRPRNDSGVTFADAIHFIDLFNYVLGRSPVRVTALMQDFMGRGMEDESYVAMEYEPNVFATVHTGYHSPGKFRSVEVLGDALSAVCDYNVAQYKIRTFANRHVVAGRDAKAEEGATHQLEFPPEEPLLAELRAFVDSMQTRQAPLADGRAGYEAVRVIEAALESVRLGQTVKLT
ncbi:MAG TPA: Gfo/Idh/MocA family oxidoreductase [Verrucomicrobiae bacterium]|nr:Gfo/Idh/MocA family oxidoreductase [Verrucomicrobiae bacterium]